MRNPQPDRGARSGVLAGVSFVAGVAGRSGQGSRALQVAAVAGARLAGGGHADETRQS